MIHLLCPTIRPDVFLVTIQEWIDKAKDISRIKIVPIVNNMEHAKILNRFDDNIFLILKAKSGVTDSLYAVTKGYEADDTDIIVVVSDDFFPPKDWDEILINEFSNFDGLIVFFDGIQKISQMATIPILTFSALKKMNRAIYHPSYIHLWSDLECFINAKELNILKDLRMIKSDIVFEHRHHSIGKCKKDEVNKLLDTFEGVDYSNFYKRMQLPLTERLKT